MRRVLWALLLGCLWCASVLAFQTAPLVENCNRTANPLGSSWVGPYDPDAASATTANGTVCIAAAASASTYWGTPIGSNTFITLDCTDCTTTGTNAIHLVPWLVEPSAVSNTVDTYRCVWQPANSVLQISKVMNGATGVQLPSSPATVTISTGDKLGCQKIGATISGWIDHGSGWQLVLATTDPTPFATVNDPGYVGILTSTTAVHMDNIDFGPVTSQRLGLLYTQEEVEIWQQRVTAGPYNTDDWNNILSNGNAWSTSPSARVPGQVSATCYDANGTALVFDRRTDSGMMDSAFIYLMTGDTSYREPVITELLAQAATPGTDFSDTARFCPANEQSQTLSTDIGPWIFRLLMAYDFVKSAMTPAERSTMEAWFHASAVYYEQMTSLSLTKRMSGRLTGDHTCTGSVGSSCPGPDLGLSHFGGSTVKTFSRGWNNIAGQMTVNIAAIGILVNDTTLQARARLFFQEWLAYGVYVNSVLHDQYRWSDGSFLPQRGYLYPASMVASMSLVADLFARTGDMSLYTYSTASGLFGTEGPPAKTLLTATQHVAGQTNNTILNYASTTSTSDDTLLIDHLGPITAGGQRGEMVYLAIGSQFFQDPSVKTAYTLPFPSGLDTSGYDPSKGPWGTLPAVRFQYEQMEGLVWPYSGSSSSYSLTATPSSVAAGGALSVSWSAPAGRPATDWIALYKTGATNTKYLWRSYTNGAASGSATLAAPTRAGTYIFRYLLQDGFTSTAKSNRVTVK